MKRWLMSVAVLVAFAAAGGAQAQCAGFTDVGDDGPMPTGQNCPAVHWLKNRAVTIGCTSLTLFCPGTFVNRQQMALFLHRLGKVITPEVVVRQGSSGAVTLPGPPPEFAILRCISDNTAGAVYPRQALVHASFSGLADGNAAAFRAFLLVSTDSGATYSLLDLSPVGGSIGHRATGAANAWTNVGLVEGLELAVNTTYQFAIGVRRDDIGPVTTGNLAATRCQLAVAVNNLNGTSVPY